MHPVRLIMTTVIIHNGMVDEEAGTNAKHFKGIHHADFAQYYNNEEFSDLNLYVGNNHFKSHKIVLSSCSEVFKTMLSTAWCTENETILQESIQCEEVFDIFLKFFYTSEVVFTEENVVPLLLLADKYMVKELARLGIGYMVSVLDSENVLPWYKFSLKFNIDNLYTKCVSYISHNLEEFINQGKLVELDVDQLLPILDSGVIVITSEMKIVTAIINWLKAYDRTSEENIVEDVFTLMKCVRFPMLSPPELDKLERFPELKEVRHKIIPYLYVGYKFHSLANVTMSHFSEDSQKYFVPRIYTNQRTCCTITNQSPDVIDFQTPFHLAAQRSTMYSIKWTYNKKFNDDPFTLQLTMSPTCPPVKVRIVTMTKRCFKGFTEVVIMNDAIHNIMPGTLRVVLGSRLGYESFIHKYGFSISIIPQII
ncbi:hypothetical protein KUTeg_017358 [Tegillarca granosa]|uniref:BTB domain-containing protein n=1 Tax=Tegillarca granosa TaxID=220873 RepID=A0ABQ9EIF4_TEGGR|nr:hypothetical protein KUTeg_017358 [Tegillarca granosa]